MKTKFKHINFVQQHFRGIWLCFTNSSPPAELGFCEYHEPWRCWQFAPAHGTAFTADCCRDIAHFLEQLGKKK